MKHGPAADPIYIGEPKPLARSDLDQLKERGRTPTNTIKRIRDSHHMIARLTAMGLKPGVVADRMGMTRERVTQLAASPAMIELIAIYRQKVDERFSENADAFFEVASRNMMAAQRHIADRFSELDDEGELMPLREALAVAADSADRVGYGKLATKVNINTDFASQLERAIKRSAKVVDVTPSPARSEAIAPAPPKIERRRA